MIDVQWPRANLKDFPELADDPNIKMDCWGDFVVTAYAASILRELHKISTKIDVPFVRDGKTWLRVTALRPDGRSADAEAEVLRVPEWESQAIALQILQTRLMIEATLKLLKARAVNASAGSTASGHL